MFMSPGKHKRAFVTSEWLLYPYQPSSSSSQAECKPPQPLVQTAQFQPSTSITYLVPTHVEPWIYSGTAYQSSCYVHGVFNTWMFRQTKSALKGFGVEYGGQYWIREGRSSWWRWLCCYRSVWLGRRWMMSSQPGTDSSWWKSVSGSWRIAIW